MRPFTVLAIVVFLSGCGGNGADAPAALSVFSLAAPTSGTSAQANLAAGPAGRLVLSWLAHDEDRVTLKFSEFGAHGWRPAQAVAQGGDWFVNWADFPSVVPLDRDVWAAHWLVKRPGGTYSYDVAIAISRDAGRTWGAAITPHTDNTPTEHGFVSLFPTPAGAGAIWLDGREMEADGHDHAGDGAATQGGMTLRAADIGQDSTLIWEALVDDLVCDCCQTDVAMTAHGPVVVYRNRKADETRDIYVASRIDGVWQTPQAVAHDDWVIAGCPVNGPAIAARGGDVAVAWFTAADDLPRVRLAFSNDGGRSFAPAVDVDTHAPLGRVGVALLEDGSAVVSWARPDADTKARLAVRTVTGTGALGPVQIVAHSVAIRSFPQIATHGPDLVLAWTDGGGAAPRVRTARLRVQH